MSSPPCEEGESCKAAPTPQPEIFGPPPSATFNGAGNVTPEPAKPAVEEDHEEDGQVQAGLEKKHGKCVKSANLRRPRLGKPTITGGQRDEAVYVSS